MADPEGAMVIAQVSSDIWWSPALMAAVRIICTAVAMSIRSVPWGRSRSKEEPRPPPGWHSAVAFPTPVAPDDPPVAYPSSRVPEEQSGEGILNE